MGSVRQRPFDADRIFDDVLLPGEGSYDTHFVDSLLATLQVPASIQSQPEMPSQAQPRSVPGSTPAIDLRTHERQTGSAQSAQDRHLEKEPSGGSSGSERGHSNEQQALAPSLRVREKNKRAQRAFRQRQKEKSQAMGRELKEVTEKLESVTLERELLQQRNKLLEMALANSRGKELPPEAEEIMCTTAPPLNALANRISPTAPQLEPLPIVHGNAWDAGEFSLHTGNGRTYSFNDAIVKKFTLDEVVHVWEEIVTYMSELLVTAAGNASSQAGKDLQEVVFSTIRLIARISSHNWRLKYSWLTNRIGGNLAMLGYQCPQFNWPAILEAMHLAQWQKDKILEHRSRYLAALANIMQERQEVEQGLQALALGKESVITVTQQHMALHNLAQRLGRLWQHTYQCMGAFFKVIWNEVFDSFQAANFAVQAYPFAPDTLALAARLASDAGLPAAEDVLATRFPSAIMAAPVSSTDVNSAQASA